MDRIVEALLPTRELCFLPTTSVFALHKAQLNSLSAFTLAAAVRYVRFYLPALGFRAKTYLK